MASERLAPGSIVASSNLSGGVGDIDDDPDSPDANWLTQVSGGADTDVRVSFPSPSDDPETGAGLQEFRVQVRSGQNSGFRGNGSETYDIFLYEAGVEVATLASGVVLDEDLVQVDAYTWDASVLSDPSGADVELRILGNVASGGGPSGDRAAVEVGAIEWNAEIPESTTPVATSVVHHSESLSSPVRAKGGMFESLGRAVAIIDCHGEALENLSVTQGGQLESLESGALGRSHGAEHLAGVTHVIVTPMEWDGTEPRYRKGVFRPVAPEIDGSAAMLGDGTPRRQMIYIPAGQYETPFWIKTSATTGICVQSLPWRGVVKVAQLEVVSTKP